MAEDDAWEAEREERILRRYEWKDRCLIWFSDWYLASYGYIADQRMTASVGEENPLPRACSSRTSPSRRADRNLGPSSALPCHLGRSSTRPRPLLGFGIGRQAVSRLVKEDRCECGDAMDPAG